MEAFLTGIALVLSDFFGVVSTVKLFALLNCQ